MLKATKMAMLNGKGTVGRGNREGIKRIHTLLKNFSKLIFAKLLAETSVEFLWTPNFKSVKLAKNWPRKTDLKKYGKERRTKLRPAINIIVRISRNGLC